MKRLIIKIFGLTDISDLIYDAVISAEKKAEKEKKILRNELEKFFNRKLELTESAYKTEIRLLERRISEYEKAEKYVNELEFKSKKQIQENFRVAAELSAAIKGFTLSVNSIFGEVMGISDKVSRHKKTIGE
jgi:hypothetical protein